MRFRGIKEKSEFLEMIILGHDMVPTSEATRERQWSLSWSQWEAPKPGKRTGLKSHKTLQGWQALALALLTCF